MSSIAGLLMWRKRWWLAALLGLAGLGELAADGAEAVRPKSAPVVAAAEETTAPATPENPGAAGSPADDPVWLRTSREAEEQEAQDRPALTPSAPGAAPAAAYGGPPARATASPPRRTLGVVRPALLGPNGQSTGTVPASFATPAPARLAAPAAVREMARLPAVDAEAPRAAVQSAAPAATQFGAPQPGSAQLSAPHFDAVQPEASPAAAPLAGFTRGEPIKAEPKAPAAVLKAAAAAPHITTQAALPPAVAAPAPAATPTELKPTPAAENQTPAPAAPLAGFTKGEAVTPHVAPVAEPKPEASAAAPSGVVPAFRREEPASNVAPRTAQADPTPSAPQSQSERMAAEDKDANLPPVFAPSDAAAKRLLERAGTLPASATSETGGATLPAVFRPRTQAPGEARELRPLGEPAIFNGSTVVSSSENPIRAARSNQPLRMAQVPPPADDPFRDDPLRPLRPAGPAGPGGAADPGIDVTEGPFEPIEATGTLEVMFRRSLLLRTKSDIYRTAVVDSQICEVVQFTPREVSIIGKGQGATSVTFWFNDGRHRPVTYVVKVRPDIEERRRLEGQYKLLQDIVREQFPDSKVYLIPVADKLIVKGQAKDAEEAAQVMAIIRGQTSASASRNAYYNLVAQGQAAQVLGSTETGRQAFPRIQVINMLRVPGVQQVALRTKIAELNRSAARGFGVDVEAKIDFSNSSSLLLNSMLNATTGAGPALIASFDGDDVLIGVRFLQQKGVIRVLSEPTLVTMSGSAATFVAGGEFAVPTIVGSAGLNAVTTDFRAYGVILSFTPTVLDKDRIRLQVAPEFSQINSDNSVNGVPGLNVRAVTTTVEMREGQTLAIAGLLDDSMKSSIIGDLPLLWQIFGRRDVTRTETELIILVSPELVHPMEPEEVPPLPGYDVTEPTDWGFYALGNIEGKPTLENRSTVWRGLRNRYRGSSGGMVSGPYGHGN